MQSFLIISRNKNISEKEASNICQKYNIDNFDIAVLQQEENSIGIENIRILQNKVSLKPFKSKYKAAIIKDAEKLTREAQNALLKTLEEPPTNTILILIATNKEVFLPTVLSRCKIIEIKEKILDLSQKDNDQFTGILNSLSWPNI